MKRTLREAVAAEERRDLWAAMTAAIGDMSAMRADPEARCVAVWPMESLPESYAEEMQRALGKVLAGDVVRCCRRLLMGGIMFAAWPSIVYCPECYADADLEPDGIARCDACHAAETGDGLYRVLAVGGPYIVEGWLCERCAS